MASALSSSRFLIVRTVKWKTDKKLCKNTRRFFDQFHKVVMYKICPNGQKKKENNKRIIIHLDEIKPRLTIILLPRVQKEERQCNSSA